MSSVISAGTNVGSGLEVLPDTSGALALQTSRQNALTINGSQNPVCNSVGGIRVPSGTTAQRPASPVSGMLRYNTTISKLEIYINGWIPLA